MKSSGYIGLIAALTLAFAPPALAESQGLDSSAPPPTLEQVGITQRVGVQLPLDLAFTDEHGKRVELDRYFHQRPVVLALVYYECPMLCTEVLNGLVRSLAPLKLDVGKDFDIVTVSFNPAEDAHLATQKKKVYLERYGRAGAESGWRFLTGEESAIRALADSVGFRYTYDAATQQFAHGSAIMVVTPEGVLSRYYFGIEYPTKDLRLSLVEASDNKIGTVFDQVMLYCFHYDPEQGKYGLVIMNVIRVAGLATLFVMGTFMLVMFRRDRHAKHREHSPENTG
jgi:protein SCO1/2